MNWRRILTVQILAVNQQRNRRRQRQQRTCCVVCAFWWCVKVDAPIGGAVGMGSIVTAALSSVTAINN